MRTMYLVARTTFLEFWRQPLVLVAMVLAVMATGGGWWWRDFNFGETEARFLINFGLGVQGLVGVLLCTVGAAQTWSRELEQNTATVLKTLGVSPLSMVGGKVMGVWGLSLVYLAVSTAWLVLLIGGRADDQWWRMLVEGELRLGTMFVLVASCASWFATYGKSMMFVVLTSWLFMVVGNLHGLIGESGFLLRYIVPDLRWLGPGSADRVDESFVALMAPRVAYAAAYTGAFVGLAAWGWSRRES